MSDSHFVTAPCVLSRSTKYTFVSGGDAQQHISIRQLQQITVLLSSCSKGRNVTSYWFASCVNHHFRNYAICSQSFCAVNSDSETHVLHFITFPLLWFMYSFGLFLCMSWLPCQFVRYFILLASLTGSVCLYTSCLTVISQ